MNDELLTRRNIANQKKVAIATVKSWDKKKLISPVCFINGRPRYDRKEVDALLITKPNT